MCWYTIIYQPHTLVHSGLYSLQNLREKWDIWQLADPPTVFQVPKFVWPPPRPSDGYYYFHRLNTVCDPVVPMLPTITPRNSEISCISILKEIFRECTF
ncbi:hypothetical protein TNCV_4105591 [Trichonephila clavipes]|nr:hypothetical protein TNCV_4105591 [Trichonephila clavipes]